MPSAGEFSEVVAAAQAGAEWAIATLYRSEQPALLRYLSARLPQDAEDIASQVWLEAARGLDRFEGDATDFRCWLFVIARRRLSNEHRRVGRAGLTYTDPTALIDRAGSADTEGDALGAVSGDVAARRLMELLPKAQAEVVLLRVVAGFDVDQVAELIGRKPGHVRVLQHRALRTLAKKLDAPVTEDGVAEIWEAR
jgi:RNA polymerase sigma-70 factor, ECF subfamily